MTVHVTPEDEPVAGQPSLILVEKVKTRTGRFCVGDVPLHDAGLELRRARCCAAAASRPRTTFTFPEPGAYRITVAGRVKRAAGWRWFKVSFAIRANERS